MQGTSKTTTFPAPGSANNGNGPGKTANLPVKNANPIRVKEKHERTFGPRQLGSRGGNSSPHLASSPSRNSFNSMGGGGGHGGGGGRH